ncbi:hypothetical protein [Limnobaculum xujianqingii]|uniref:hypothetical protein n=1 Tax=Limnobaculum xujianqingii TaxID=2738837 RepID=UPI0015B81F39|nr:hypothetical protein [Limnobaculum xujianqingii]
MGLYFKQSMAVERSELLVRLIVDAQCSEKDKEIAIAWIADTLGNDKKLSEHKKNSETDNDGIFLEE